MAIWDILTVLRFLCVAVLVWDVDHFEHFYSCSICSQAWVLSSGMNAPCGRAQGIPDMDLNIGFFPIVL